MLTFSGCFTGEGTPLKYWTGRKQTKRSSNLAQRDVERANAAADRRRQRTLDADQEFAERLDRVVGQPAVEFVFRCLSGKNFEPRNLLFPAVGFLHRGVENANARRPNVWTGSITADKWNNWIIWDNETGLIPRNLFASRRFDVFVRHKVHTVEAAVLSRNPRRGPRHGGKYFNRGLHGLHESARQRPIVSRLRCISLACRGRCLSGCSRIADLSTEGNEGNEAWFQQASEKINRGLRRTARPIVTRLRCISLACRGRCRSGCSRSTDLSTEGNEVWFWSAAQESLFPSLSSVGHPFLHSAKGHRKPLTMHSLACRGRCLSGCSRIADFIYRRQRRVWF